MVAPTDAAARRGRLRSIPALAVPEIGGISVRVDPTALLIMALIRWGGSPDVEMSSIVAFALVAVASIIVHELGHAFAFKAFGHRTHVLIYGMGGLTSSVGGTPKGTRAPDLTPARDLVVDVAGPLAGFALGAAVYLGWDAPASALASEVRFDILFATFAWGLLNLMPIYPLDGGQALLAILRAAKVSNADRTVRVISIGVAGVGGVLAYKYLGTFTGLFALFFAAQNLSDLRQMKQEPQVAFLRDAFAALAGDDHATARSNAQAVLAARPPPELTGPAAEVVVWASLGLGDVAGARAALALRPPPLIRQDRTVVPNDRFPEAAVALAEWILATPDVRASLGVEGTFALVAASLDRGEWAPPALFVRLLGSAPAGADRVLVRCTIPGRRRLGALAEAANRPDLVAQALAGLD